MTRGILIAGSESVLLSAVESEAAKRVEQYAIALISNRFSGDSAKSGLQGRRENALSETSSVKGRIPLDWNPGSPISAHTLVLAAKNRLERIDEAILVCNPPSVRCAAADLSLADIEVLVNDHIKGWFYLVKELAAVFRTQEKGTLALAYPETSATGGKEDVSDLLGQTALAAFRSLVRGLLDSVLNEPYITMGFTGADNGEEVGYATFIFKQIEDGNRRGNGKLHKYGKLGIFR